MPHSSCFIMPSATRHFNTAKPAHFLPEIQTAARTGL